MAVEHHLYFISMAARLLDMHPQTLRKYERLGLVRPTRTVGSMRVYSREELERLRLIKRLVEEDGVNLAGVQRLLDIAEAVQRLRPLVQEGTAARRSGNASRRRSNASDEWLGSRGSEGSGFKVQLTLGRAGMKMNEIGVESAAPAARARREVAARERAGVGPRAH